MHTLQAPHLVLSTFPSVYKGIEVKIIMSENDPANLGLYEAFYIRECKPSLNSILETIFKHFRGPLSRGIPSLEPCIPFAVYFFNIHTYPTPSLH